MLTKKQILKVSRLEDQTGESEGFYEPNFDKRHRTYLSSDKKIIIRLKLIIKELPNGDVVIQKG